MRKRSIAFGAGGVAEIGVVERFLFFQEVPVLYRFPHDLGLVYQKTQVVDGKQLVHQEFLGFKKVGKIGP